MSRAAKKAKTTATHGPAATGLKQLMAMADSITTQQASFQAGRRKEEAAKAQVAVERLRGEPLDAVLSKHLHELRELGKPYDPSVIEVEARIGLVCEAHGAVGASEAPIRAVPSRRGCGAVSSGSDKSFASGVSVTEALEVRSRVLRLCRGAQRVESCESVFGSDTSALDNVRLVVPHKQTAVSRIEVKSTVVRVDFCLPSAKYDVRLQLAVEEGEASLSQAARLELEKSKNAALGPWTWHRLKQRISTTWGSWRIDETTVTQRAYLGLTTEQAISVAQGASRRQGNGTLGVPTTTYELEVELRSEALQRWGEAEAELCRELVALIVALNPIEAVETRPDPTLPASAEQRDALLRTLRDSSPSWSSKRTSFPGSMPVGMCRRHLPLIQAPDGYAVAEKSDGERRLLVVFEHDGAKHAGLVDRADEARLVRLPLQSLAALDVGCVLDGEIVHNLEHRVPVFLIFDVLHDGDFDLARSAFDDRFFGSLTRRLAPALSVPCPTLDYDTVDHSAVFRHALQAETPKPEEAPLVWLVPKRFSRPRDIGRHILAKIRTDDDRAGQVAYGARVFRDDAARCHLTDGLVFVPRAREYVPGTDPFLLKWKWPDVLTVDLEIRGAGKGGDLSPCAMGDDGDSVDCSKHVVLDPHDQARLRADLHFYADLANTERRPLVAELGLEVKTGLWLYHGPRPDKKSANHFDVFISTILLHAESPDQPELEYRLKASSPDKDDWHKVLARALSTATSPWVEHFSKSQNRPYWYNRDTQQSVWDRPAELGGH